MTESNPVSLLRRINDGGDLYHAIFLWCPGCEYILDDRKVGGLHALPINGNPKKRPVWSWNKDLVRVTLSPSILTRTSRHNVKFICHSFLRDGRWQFLGDCTHSLKSKTVPMTPLPDWVVR